jgi:hypothetical protein
MTTVDEGQALQFETVLPRESASSALVAEHGVTCRPCQRAIPDEYFDVNGEPVCIDCRDELFQHAKPPSGAGPLTRAALFGLAAAIAGAILYYAVIAITNLEIGLVAIAIGYMVGYAIQKGTGGRSARRFQVMALVLTYWSVGLAYLPLVVAEAAGTEASAPSEGSDVVAPVPAEPPQPASTPPADDDVNLPGVVAYLFGLSFALPVLMIVGSLPGGLISAAIIGFGMHQAWRMTAPPQFTVTGPFRVRTAEPSAT